MTIASRTGDAARFFDGGSFPAFALGVLVFWGILLLAMLIGPGEDSSMRGFADEFRIWCFGYDQQGLLRKLSKNPITPAPEELSMNPSSRSAKLRVAERI